MATMQIDQVTPGPGTNGQSRHDLVPGEIITLVATAPVGGGVTYAWEILDKVGSAAVLSAGTGATVTIGLAGAIVRPCAFLIKLTANDNGTITTVTRIASVRTLNASLRVPLFPETAPATNRLAANTPDLSTDNASYPNRAGLGAGQNWRGWSEWAWELTNAVDTLAGGGTGITELTGDVDAGPGTGSVASTVVALQGVDVSAVAPANGDVLTYNGGTTEWEAAPPTGGSGTTSLFVYEEGGAAAGNVYTTWASLYTAVNAVAGVKIVHVSEASGTPEISAGAFNLHDWTFVGNYDVFTGSRPTLTIRTGVTITGNFRAERMVIALDAGATAPIVYSGSSTRIFEFVDTTIDGGVANNGLFTAAAAGSGLRFILRGDSRMLSAAVLLTAVGQARIEAHDQSQIDADAVSGVAGTLTIVLVDPDTVVYLATGFAGTFSLLNAVEVFNGPLSAQQLGTTELHIGSVYLLNGTRILGTSIAMLGATLVADTGSLVMRQFTGGASIASWTQAGVLASVSVVGGDVSITADDWYDLYLYANGAAETAVIRGLRLLTVRDTTP